LFGLGPTEILIVLIFLGLLATAIALPIALMRRNNRRRLENEMMSYKQCPRCLATIPVQTTKCMYCSSDLTEIPG